MIEWFKRRVGAVAAADPIGHEFTTMLISAVWAVCLLVPPSVFDTSITFHVLAYLAPEWCWGLMAGGVAVAKFVGILHGAYQWRRLSALAAVLYWGTVGVALALANPASTGGWVYLAVTLSAAWSYIWLGSNGRRQ